MKQISLLVLSFFIFTLSLQAQSKKEFDKEAIVQVAKQQLQNSSSAEGELGKFCAKNTIQGEFVFDLTLERKGNIVTVFLVSSSTKDIKIKNLLRDKLSQLQFENIKIPKKERVKFRYTLKF